MLDSPAAQETCVALQVLAGRLADACMSRACVALTHSMLLPSLSEAHVEALIGTKAKKAAAPTCQGLATSITAENKHLVEGAIGNMEEVEKAIDKPKPLSEPSAKKPRVSAAEASAGGPSTSSDPAPEFDAAASSSGLASGSGAAVADGLAVVVAEPGPVRDEQFVLRPSAGEMWTRGEASTLIPRCAGCCVSIHSGKA